MVSPTDGLKTYYTDPVFTVTALSRYQIEYFQIILIVQNLMTANGRKSGQSKCEHNVTELDV